MTGFSADWLALREPADHAARNPQLLATVGGHFADRATLTVLDLGGGTGANLRGSFAALPERQHWTLVDADAALLAAARRTLAGWADSAREQGEELVLEKDGRTLTVDTRRVDLTTDLEWVLGWRPDLVTASALFDLASRRWLERFVAALATLSLPLYAVLTYDGRERWEPHHAADAAILAAFKHHQQGDKGFGPASGPEATEIIAESFRKAGYAVSTADSSWSLGAAQAPLLAELARGIARAVGETGHVDPATVADWLEARLAGAQAGIGHHDLWARPV